MSVQHGGDSSEDQRLADPLRDSGLHVFAHLYESYAASLFDYCDGLLRETFAASDAVQDSLVAADAQTGFPPDPEQLRILLYSAARRQCLSRLPGARGGLSGHAPTATLQELGAAVPDFEVAGAAGETLLVLKAALESLSDRDREVLSLVYRHRLSIGDLATVLGVTPRRAQALLSEASVRFEQTAPVVAVLRAAFSQGQPLCTGLALVVLTRDLAHLALTPELRKQVARHLGSCADCALSRGDRAFAAEQVSEIPLVIPPGRIRLRITRTAHALGSYRRTAAGRAQEPPAKGGDTGKRGGRAGGAGFAARWSAQHVTKIMAISSVTVAALIAPVAVLHRLMSATPASSRPAVTETVGPSPAAAGPSPGAAGPSPAAATPSAAAAGTSQISPELDPPTTVLQPHPRHHHHAVQPS